MAWIAQATNNTDLVNQLTDLGVLKDPKLINAFHLTDRGDFVIPEYKVEAYYDRPFKRSFVHLSAPHMYATVLQQLDLKPGHAFLNVGSGSGYLSCLVACLLGKNGLSHGIDVNEDVVNHSRECTQRWFDRHQQLVLDSHNQDMEIPEILEEGVSFVHGNCFNIDVESSSKTCRYDRIYIGAGCPEESKEFFYSLLSDNGVMILPVNSKNVLLKVIRKSRSVFATQDISNVNFAPLIASLNTDNKITLPPVLWAPIKSRHQQYPISFRHAVMTLLLSASRLPSFQNCDINTDLSFVKHSLPFIPIHLWQYILTFTSRNWFIPTLSEVQCLTEDLAMERSMREDSEEKLKAAQKKLQRAEQERDLYKMIMMRIRRVVTNNPQQMRHQLVEVLNNSIIPGPEGFPTFTIGNTTANYVLDESDDDDDDDDDDDEEDEDNNDDEDENDDADAEDDDVADDADDDNDVDVEDEDDDEVDEQDNDVADVEDEGVVASIFGNDDDEVNNGTTETTANDNAEFNDSIMDTQTYDTFEFKIDGWFIV